MNTTTCPEGHRVSGEDTVCPICQTVLVAARPPAHAERDVPRFPGYEVVSLLGQGGMGEVYRARNLELHRDEAIKRIRNSSFAGADERLRFRKEAEAIARLKHPHIVAIYLVGEVGGDPFFAMEFVEGGSLAKQCRAKPYTPSEAAAVVEKLARAMNFAHQQRLVHLDLKPENILLTEGWEPKITDFGLARPMENEDAALSGWVGGTPGYMAPEQIETEGALIGPAADVYGLGGILYRLLTGKTPIEFSETTASQDRTVRDWRAMLRKAYEKPILPPRSIRSEVPLDLDAICRRCLARDSLDRYASANELADDLARFQRGEPTRARPVGRVERLRMWTKRNPAVATLLTLVVLAIVLGGSLVVWQWRETLYERDQAEFQRILASKSAEAEKISAAAEKKERIRATAAESKTAQALGEERRAKYFSDILLANKEYWADNVGNTLALLENCPEDLRGWEWNFLSRSCGLETMRLTGHTKAVNEIRFSRDGELIVSTGNDKVARVWKWREGKEVATFSKHTEEVLCVALHPQHSDRVITGSREGKVRVWNLHTGEETQPPLDHPADVMAVVAHPKKNLIAVGGSTGRDPATKGIVNIWDLDSGKIVHSLKGQNDWIGSLAFSPDGAWLAAGSGSGRIALWETTDWKWKKSWDYQVGGGSSSATLTFDSTSSWLAWSGVEPGISMIELKALDVPPKTIGRDQNVLHVLRFSPDKEFLATAGVSKIVRFYEYENLYRDVAAGKYLDVLPKRSFPQLRGHTHTIYSLDFSPDGNWLASGCDDTTIRIWRTKYEYDPRVLFQAKGVIRNISLSEDGRRLLFCGIRGNPTEIPDNAHVAVLDVDDGGVYDYLKLSLATSSFEFLDRAGTEVLIATDGSGVYRWKLGSNEFREIATPGESSSVVAVDLQNKAWAVAEGGLGMLSLLRRDQPGKIFVYGDANPLQPRLTLRGHDKRVAVLKFSRDGKRLASSGYDSKLHLWNLETGALERTLTFPEPVFAMDWSPDGKQLALVHLANTGEVWDMQGEPKKIHTLPGFRNIPSRIRYNPQGTRLATTQMGTLSSDLRVWDVATGREILSCLAHTGSTWGLAFLEDGRLLTAGSDNFIRVWDGRPSTETSRKEPRTK